MYEDDLNNLAVPVPKPRRHVIVEGDFNGRTSYENVSMDLINKNIDIKNENLQNNSKNKLQVNKTFILPTPPAAATTSVIPTTLATSTNGSNDVSMANVLTKLNDLQVNNNGRNCAINLDEVNKLSNIYNDDENNQKPVPAPRRSNTHSAAKLEKVFNEKTALNANSCAASTGAISKTTNKNVNQNEEKSKKSNASGSYSLVSDDVDSIDSSGGKFSLNKSLSSSSLASTQSGSSNTEGSGSKYHTTSPGQLLKALGATSKLLTESITERVTNRTKDAKHKIDKIHKNSRDRIAETTKSATNKLKTVRKNIHDKIELTQSNLSLGRNNHKKMYNNKPSIPEFDSDRPQTMPANDDLFQSISFHSPLQSKTNNCMNINTAESSYEIPKNNRIFSSDSSELSATRGSLPAEPPSYDDIMRDELQKGDNIRPNPTARNRSKNKINSNSYENCEIDNNGNNKQSKKNRSESTSDDENYAVPCPNFPAPVLTENIYGKVKNQLKNAVDDVAYDEPVQPPIRSKRRKDYEEMLLRSKIEIVNSNRATVDSNEFKTDDDKFPKIFARDISEDFTEKLRFQESLVPHPDRSESWSYYDTNSDEPSSPEPIYANEDGNGSSEPVYGVLYNADSPDGTLLTPHAIERKRRSAEKQIKTGGESSSLRSKEPKCSTDILKEFDPLDRKTLDKLLSNKSNELILLENLLGEETYGNCTDENILEYNSLETSEDEESNDIPAPPERLDSLKEDANEEHTAVCRNTSSNDQNDENRKTIIIHQNMSLRSDSADNLVDQVNAESISSSPSASPSAVDDLAAGSSSKSCWFFSTSDKNDKKNSPKGLKDEKGPPSYNEAIGVDEFKDFKSNASIPSDKRTSSTKTSVMSMFSNVMNKMEGIKRKTSFRSNAGKNEVKTILEMIPRPSLTQRLILHEGHLIRLPSRQDILKELHSRKAYIRDKKFQAYFDKDMKVPKENIPLEWITAIQCVNNPKFSNNFVDIYCFEITTAIPKNVNEHLSNPNMIMTTNNSGNTKTQRVCHLYGVAKESERFIWMQKLLDSVTEVFPPGFTCRFYRAGWCYSKNSITSKWSGSWILLQKEKRRLLFYNYLEMNLECMDLRKARCLVLKESDDSIKNLHVESGPTLMIDCPPYTMYFIMTSPRETKIWRHIIQEVAHNNGPSLKEQQLTKDNVPVLVDKCINFIYAHGSMSEGIYRKSGSENSIQKLLKIFRTDAYSAQIIRGEYNEHDVANALKRFMRDLPDRLLGKYTSSLISVSEMKDVHEKMVAYKELLTRLPSIEYHTLKKLLGHLHFIQSQKELNKMDVANIAIVWGPTLLQNKQIENNYSQGEADVIIDLIKYYKNLYALSADEVAKEQIMLTVLQKYHAAAENLSDSMKKSGDLKVWITIDANPDNENEEKPQINVTLTPNKTVHEICKELAPKIKREAFAVTLSEIILNDTLQRPLHHSEKVFDLVLKWSYWPEADRKNNYLRLRPMKFMKEVERALKVLPSISPNKELKFADCKTKSLKLYTLELNDGKITVMKKEKNTIVKVREIELSKTTAYLGCEKKRDFQLRWAITLIEDSDAANKSNLRTRESPFIGHVIAGTNSNDQIVWYSSILHSLYGDNIMPNPEIIIP